MSSTLWIKPISANDRVLNIVLSGGLAVAMIFTSLIQGYRGNLMSVLFGDILARLVLLSVIVDSILSQVFSSLLAILVLFLFSLWCMWLFLAGSAKKFAQP